MLKLGNSFPFLVMTIIAKLIYSKKNWVMSVKIFIDSELRSIFKKKKLPDNYVNYFHDLIEVLTGSNRRLCLEGNISINAIKKKGKRTSKTYRNFFYKCLDEKIFTKLEKGKYLDDVYFISINPHLCKHIIVREER